MQNIFLDSLANVWNVVCGTTQPFLLPFSGLIMTMILLLFCAESSWRDFFFSWGSPADKMLLEHKWECPFDAKN